MIKNKKLVLAGALDRLKLLDLLRGVKQPSLTVINYHRVYDGSIRTDFDEQVFEASAEHFDAQVKWLKGHFDALDEAAVIDLATSGRPFTGRHVFITFDDAYADNYDIAYPILKAHAMPAIFFAPTQIISDRRLGWWDLISYFVKATTQKEVSIAGATHSLDTPGAREVAIGNLLRTMKSLDESETRDLVATLAERCEVDPPPSEVQSAQLMTWEQLREVSENGVAVGSHTHSHRVLATLPAEVQKSELVQSRQLLEDRIGKPVRSLAYPVGGPSAFTEETKSLAREAGYEVAFAFHGGVNHGRISDRFSISRISPPDQLSVYKATVTMPSVFA